VEPRDAQRFVAEDRRLLATAHDPELGVHVVGEFLYCPRAGVIAYEADYSDAGLDQRSIRLGYLPRYTVQAITALIGKGRGISVVAMPDPGGGSWAPALRAPT